jgi:hypothetical protein
MPSGSDPNGVSPVSRNVVRVRSGRKQFRIDHGAVVLASTLALAPAAVVARPAVPELSREAA